jgi:hypothetical protein
LGKREENVTACRRVGVVGSVLAYCGMRPSVRFSAWDARVRGGTSRRGFYEPKRFRKNVQDKIVLALSGWRDEGGLPARADNVLFYGRATSDAQERIPRPTRRADTPTRRHADALLLLRSPPVPLKCNRLHHTGGVEYGA